MFLLIGGPGSMLLLDAVQSRAQHHREREIRIARRVGHAQLDARRRAARGRDADERAAVLLGPRDVGRRLVAGHQPLVRIHERIGDRAEALRVAQDAADVVAGRSGSAASAPSASKKMFALFAKSDMCVCMPEPLMP